MIAWFIPRNMAAAVTQVSMMVGDTKTLYLPSSVTSQRLYSVTFLSYGVEYVDVASYTTTSVKVKALKKTPSAGVIVRCNYKYYVLRSGKWVYGGSGIYDYNVKVSGIDPTGVSLPEDVHLERGESKVLEATLSPSNASTELTWKSSAYATVNIWQTGKILGQQRVTSIITVTTSNGLTAQCKVTVGTPDVLPTSVHISTNLSSLKVGESFGLSATVLPLDATDKTVTWSSNNPSVISVGSSTGTLKGLQTGWATITVRTANGLTDSRLFECKDALPSITLNDSEGWEATLPSAAHVDYNRTFQKGWNSMCVPFAVSLASLNNVSQGLRMAVVKEMEVVGDRKNIVLMSIDNVRAGQPCLVYAESDVCWTIHLNAATLAEAPLDDSILKGSYTRDVVGAGCGKITQDGTSYSTTKTDEAIVHPFRCYIKEE